MKQKKQTSERCFVCDVLLSTKYNSPDPKFKIRQQGLYIAGGRAICAACNMYEVAARLNTQFVKSLGSQGGEFEKHKHWDKITRRRQNNTIKWLEAIAEEMDDKLLTFPQMIAKLGQIKRCTHKDTEKLGYFIFTQASKGGA